MGVGTTSPGALLDVKASSTRQIRVATESSNNAGLVQCTESTGNNRDIALGGQNVTFCVGAFDQTSRSEVGRFDTSGRLKVGTTADIIWNQTSVDGVVIEQSGATQIVRNGDVPLLITRNTSTGQIVKFSQAGTERGSILYDGDFGISSASDLTFDTNGSEKARIDSSGNVGIGPDSLDSLSARTALGYRSLRVQNANITAAGGSFANFGVNYYQHTDGVLKYIDAGYSGRIDTWGDSIQFHLSNGAAADDNISGSERMRIDSSGRLLVGTSSSPTGGDGQYANLIVQGYAGGNTGPGYTAIARGQAATAPFNSTTEIGRLAFTDSTGASFAYISSRADGNTGSGDYPGRLVFATTADGAPSPTERMRIDNAGKTGININNPGSYNGSGNELVLGNTGSNSGMTIVSNSANNGHIFFADGTAAGAQNRGIIKYEHGNDAMAFNTAETERLRITSNGTLQLRNSPGIDFSQIQTNAAGMTSETLDSYEEGTWTPSISSSSGTITTSSGSGRYVKIGRLVTVHFVIVISNEGTANGAFLNFGNLPFTSSNTHNQVGVCREQAINGFLSTAQITGNATTGSIIRYDNAGVIVNNGNYQCTITYEAQ
jgi:hypothetical protein